MTALEFEAWPKIPRLNRDITITEKIDGTNAAIVIEPAGFSYDYVSALPDQQAVLDRSNGICFVDVEDMAFIVGAQSRKRLLSVDSDNFGFANWVRERAETLVHLLGPGRHFGEWWGRGIQRGYGLDYKWFSLFNVHRYDDVDHYFEDGTRINTVPILATWHRPDLGIIDAALRVLADEGSKAALGYTRPEGVIVHHSASNHVYKALLEGDSYPKGINR